MRPVILQVSTADTGGGAERVALNLHQTYQLRGYRAWLAVGRKTGNYQGVLLIPNDRYRNLWVKACFRVRDLFRPRGENGPGVNIPYRFLHVAGRLGEPSRLLDRWRGREDFHFPGAWHLLDLVPQQPDLVHCHNLHGGYFDLRVLPRLSQRVPVILTLHDCWLLTGHCAHPFDCERWKIGCGQCPDLSIPPAVTRDATAENWRRKRDIYRKSRLYIATPSRWLMDKVKDSILTEGTVEYRVIPNGVDLGTFCPPADRAAVRAALNLPQQAKVLLFTAKTVRGNIWKDYATLRAAIKGVAEKDKEGPVLFIALGDQAPEERLGEAVIRFIPFTHDAATVARYYQAADLYIHAARADTFPNTVLEALACGTPVVATAVGGIPDQVKGLRLTPDTGKPIAPELNVYTREEATGILVRHGDAIAMAEAIGALLTDEELRQKISENAARNARKRFDLNRQVEAYLNWYAELTRERKKLEKIKE